MAYSDFTMMSLARKFGVTANPGVLFENLTPLPMPAWTGQQLEFGMNQNLMTEKSRGEFIIVPMLYAAQLVSPFPLTIYSGVRLDVDPAQGLVGESDFILAATLPVPDIRGPFLIILEAKRDDVSDGMWQCIAQMIGADLLNQRQDVCIPNIYGCVTNGETWQFLRLTGRSVTISKLRLFIANPELILAAFARILQSVPQPVPVAAAA